MDLDIDTMNPELVSLLKHRRTLGSWAIFTMIVSAFGGAFLTHENGDVFEWAAITFFVALAEEILGCYYLSRSIILVKRPNIILTGFILLFGIGLGGLVLYFAWDRFFSSRDNDAGLAVSIIALLLFIQPILAIFNLCNYKNGVYQRMLEMNNRLY